MSYKETFITVALDCPVDKSEIPTSNRAKKPIHIIQYELLMAKPYKFNHQELIFEVYLIKENIIVKSEEEKEGLWAELFMKGHPCLRASALTKRYGFGAHYNSDGKIALYPIESKEYKKFLNNKTVRKLAGIKSKK